MAGDALTTTSSVATVVGVVFAGWQAWGARSAAQGARTAAEAAARRFSDVLLHSLVQDLRTTDARLRTARVSNDHDAAVQAVMKWRDISGQVRALLEQRGQLSSSLATCFSSCAAFADDAEGDLVKRDGTVHDTVDGLLREMGDSLVRLSEVSIRILTEVPRADQ